MKRFRAAGEGEVESINNMANVLMLLSPAGGGGADVSSAPARVFECKTCNRMFPSFQALGGHRASHKKPKLVVGHGHSELAKPKMHECSICGLEFAIGQALGGHMRRHRADGSDARGVMEKKKSDEKRVLLWLDLNAPPSEVEVVDVCRKKIFGFEIVDAAPVAVDCFR